MNDPQRDRLTKIKQRWRLPSENPEEPHPDVQWLVAEVERLRALPRSGGPAEPPAWAAWQNALQQIVTTAEQATEWTPWHVGEMAKIARFALAFGLADPAPEQETQ
jgi:hypothetical protein